MHGVLRCAKYVVGGQTENKRPEGTADAHDLRHHGQQPAQANNETAPITKDTVWFDLLNPTKEEDNKVESLLKISVPTRAEMREIEASSRFYKENGASYDDLLRAAQSERRRQGHLVHCHLHPDR